jgi:hypothetical protein
MRQLIVLIVLRQIPPQNLEIRVTHQSLEREDIYTTAQHIERKRSAETVQGWLFGKSRRFSSSLQKQAQTAIGQPFSILLYK